MQSPLSIRAVLGVLLLALTLRGGYLAYNLAANPDSLWTWQGRAAIHAAKQFSGDPRPTPGVTDADAEFMFVNGVNGQTYLHLAIIQLFGTTSYLHLQLVHLAVDALLTLPIMLIGFLLSGRTVALWSGIVYAFFLPQWWLAIVPGYDFWASFGFIVSSSLFLWGLRRLADRPREGIVWLLCGAMTAGMAACIRPTVLLYPLAWGVLFVLLTPHRWQLKLTGFASLGCGMVAGYTPVLVHNHFIHGGAARAPSATIHQFWCGVGQFANPYGVTDNDGSIKEFYERLTGRPGPSLQYSEDYVAVLKHQAAIYLRAHPAHYASCVVRRAGLFVSGVGLRQARLDADIWKEWTAIEQRRGIREELIREYGVAGGAIRFAMIHPFQYAWYPLLVVPFVGLVAAFFVRPWREVALMACPLLYSVAVFAPYYYCERCVIAAYAASLPVWVLGLVSLGTGRSLRRPTAELQPPVC